MGWGTPECWILLGWPMNSCRPLHLLVSQDEYESPLAVTDTMDELARIAGVIGGTVAAAISRRGKAKHTSHSKYRVVWVEEDEK